MAGPLLKEPQVSMLREEIEILMNERQSLLVATGAAAIFLASIDSTKLPRSAYQSAKLLAHFLNSLPDETLQDALEKINGIQLH